MFHALLGKTTWDAIRKAANAAPANEVIELGLQWPADDPLHRLVWELLHDGDDYLVLQARPVVPIRLVPCATPAPTTIEPFRVCCSRSAASLGADNVRAGAELIGVLRGLQRNGGSVHSRVLPSATADRLVDAVNTFQPHLVHLVGHGRWDAPRERRV